MSRYLRGIIAGVVATMVLSVVLALKSAIGLFTAFNVIHLLAAVAHTRLGLPMTPVIGWIAHILIGTVLWGVLFTFFYPGLPGKRILSKAMVFATTAWVLMMFVLMPWAGKGWFGLHFGPVLPVLTLALHWIWGLAFGVAFSCVERFRLWNEAPAKRESNVASAL